MWRSFRFIPIVDTCIAGSYTADKLHSRQATQQTEDWHNKRGNVIYSLSLITYTLTPHTHACTCTHTHTSHSSLTFWSSVLDCSYVVWPHSDLWKCINLCAFTTLQFLNSLVQHWSCSQPPTLVLKSREGLLPPWWVQLELKATLLTRVVMQTPTVSIFELQKKVNLKSCRKC